MTSVRDELLALGDVDCDLRVSMAALMADVKKAFAEVGIQPYGLKVSELVVNSRQFVWIPQHLYEEDRKNSYIESLTKVDAGMAVFADHNETVGADIVFTAENSVVSAFRVAIPGLAVRCQHSKLANAAVAENSDLKSVLIVNIRDKEADYVVFCNKKLQLSNTYACESTDEVVYHALNITKQLHLEDAMMTTAVCGAVDREHFARMQKLFPNVALYLGRNLTVDAGEIQKAPLYKYAVVLS